jgi:hypothetical protein
VIERSRPWPGIVVGGLVAGVLDLDYAFLWSGLRGTSPQRLLQSVSSGLLGSSAFEGGVPSALLGLVCHFLVAFGATTVYFLAARRIAFLTEHPIAAGTIFGILVYLFMNFVVIPLSAFPIALKFPPLVLLRGFASHAFLVGIPIALAIRNFSFREAGAEGG